MLYTVHLSLKHTKVTDVSMLYTVHTLDLEYTKVSDVSMLGNVHTLNLSRTNVSNVSMLGNVQTLNLYYTKYLFPLSDQGQRGQLRLNGTVQKLTDVSMLGTNVTNVTMLSKVKNNSCYKNDF